MSHQVPTHFVQAYTTNVEMLLQQRGGKLLQSVTQGSYTGKGAKAVEQIGPVAPVKNLSRHADTPLISTPADSRWVFPNDYEWADLIDDQDRLRMLIDPQSAYVMNAVNAMRRAQDSEILQAMYATSATGENGTTSTAFPAGQIVGVNVGGANSNLNVAKLRAAKRLLMAAGVDLEQEKIFAAITAADHDGLLNEIQVTSLDYNNKPTLVEGRVTSFMGINFIPVEFSDAVAYPDVQALLINGATRLVPVWTTGAIHIGMWNDITTRVSIRDDKRYATQVYAKTTAGATRTQEKKVVQIVTTG
jgi:Phage capsid protein